jgi:glucose dehydrogenase
MSTYTASAGHAPRVSPGLPLLALRYLALLSTLNVIYQGATAGRVLMKSHEALALHEAGAVVIHVLTGLTMITAALLWRSSRGSLWPTALAAVVFVATFVQALTGHGTTLYIHVPLALLILLGSALLLSWSWFGARRPVTSFGDPGASE